MKRLPLCKEVHWVLWCQIPRIQNLTDICFVCGQANIVITASGLRSDEAGVSFCYYYFCS